MAVWFFPEFPISFPGSYLVQASSGCGGLMTTRLRSHLWSSETMAQGMQHVSEQPKGFLAKSENFDEELDREFQVACQI